MDDEAVQAIANDDLTGKATGDPASGNELENVRLVANGRADGVEPGLVDKAVAGRARTATAALGTNARNTVVDGTIHHASPGLSAMHLARAVRVDENNGWHARLDSRKDDHSIGRYRKGLVSCPASLWYFSAPHGVCGCKATRKTDPRRHEN